MDQFLHLDRLPHTVVRGQSFVDHLARRLRQEVLTYLCDGAHGVHHVRRSVQRMPRGMEGLLSMVADRVHRVLP